MPDSDINRQVLSVSELNRMAKQLLEIHLPLMWIEGEISNFSKPSSGHWYFTLKDDNAQVRCAMFKGRNTQVRFIPKSGDKLVVRAKVSLYEGRGDYQLIVEHMEDAGFGLLQRQFEALKKQLQQEGLFDSQLKQPIPVPPSHLAVITSPTGAAIKDVLSVLNRRFPCLAVTVVPAPVQGEDAPHQLIKALQTADANDDFDVILLTRGGGSIEDLWAFNNEALARAIANCHTPVVSAVGHEVDNTIADYVADLRAPTPSAAAELLSPNGAEISSRLIALQRYLQESMRRGLKNQKQQLYHLRQRIRHPGQQLQSWAQRLDQAELRLRQAFTQIIRQNNAQTRQLNTRLFLRNPSALLGHQQEKYQAIDKRLRQSMLSLLQHKRDQLEQNLSLLNIVSPLNTLQRGYAIVKNDKGKIIRQSSELSSGQLLDVIFSEGTASVVVNRDKTLDKE